MLLTQATYSRLLFVFEYEHTVNNGNCVLELNLRERVSYAPTDMLRVAGLALKDDAQTDDCREWRNGRLSQPRCDRRNLEGAGNTDNIDLGPTRLSQFLFRRSQHGIDVSAIVFRGDNG